MSARPLLRLLTFVAFCGCMSSPAAEAANPGRSFGLTVGAGLGHDWVSLQTPTARSRFDGWGPSAEVGLDVPLTERFGLLFGARYHRGDLNNAREDGAFLEKAVSSGFDGRAGIYWGPVSLGYGLGAETLRVRQVSVTSGASDLTLSGSAVTYFAAYSLPVLQQLKTSPCYWRWPQWWCL